MDCVARRGLGREGLGMCVGGAENNALQWDGTLFHTIAGVRSQESGTDVPLSWNLQQQAGLKTKARHHKKFQGAKGCGRDDSMTPTAFKCEWLSKWFTLSYLGLWFVMDDSHWISQRYDGQL